MTMRPLGLAAAAAVLISSALSAQSLTRRIDQSDGAVQFTFASRPGVCGDGRTYVRDGLGGNSRIYEGGNFSGRSRGDDWPPCVAGPVRVVATLSKGELLRLHTYAGPRADRDDARDLGTVSVEEAIGYLTRVVEQASGRAANDAILPIVLADSLTPWPMLLRFARNERLARGIRSNASFWLSRGASAKLGLSDHDEDENDDVRNSAVFALSQQPKDVAVPELIEVARRNAHAAARAQALFWLGQSGDARAIDLFEDILRR